MCEKETKLKEQELEKVNGGLIQPSLRKYHCNSCCYEFNEPENGACPYCHGTDIKKRW